MPQVYSRASQTCSRPVWQQPMHRMSSLVSQSWQTDIVGFGSWFMCVCAHARARVPGRLHSRIRQLVHVCVRAHTRAHKRVCARVPGRLHSRIRQLVHVCVCVRTRACLCGFGSWFMCVCVQACMPGCCKPPVLNWERPSRLWHCIRRNVVFRLRRTADVAAWHTLYALCAFCCIRCYVQFYMRMFLHVRCFCML